MNGSQIVMSRETQDKVYPQLVKHQAAYEEKVAEYNALQKPVSAKTPVAPAAPAPISIETCAILFLLLIFPFVLYLVYKIKQKNEYLAALEVHKSVLDGIAADYQKAMNEYNATKSMLVAKAETIAAESRAIFFGPRD
jgi:hypothetical protein